MPWEMEPVSHSATDSPRDLGQVTYPRSADGAVKARRLAQGEQGLTAHCFLALDMPPASCCSWLQRGQPV